MLKYAFIFRMPGCGPDEYRKTYVNEESDNLLLGVPDAEATKVAMKQLAADGYTLINLCGDYDDGETESLQAIAGEGVKITHADYFPEELEKVNNLESDSPYGIIVKMAGVESPERIDMPGSVGDALAIFVKDQEQAKEAAKELVGRGATFIEVCSWFDKEKTAELIEAIDHAVPIGSAGPIA